MGQFLEGRLHLSGHLPVGLDLAMGHCFSRPPDANVNIAPRSLKQTVLLGCPRHIARTLICSCVQKHQRPKMTVEVELAGVFALLSLLFSPQEASPPPKIYSNTEGEAREGQGSFSAAVRRETASTSRQANLTQQTL